ncbi:AI-2E family transporter [uncultured Helicobacter sp.]|uniref:AI-2E family transporter n=1 Tax=uncultured Helicobacter sp. TaxID=175537 RepID=UPI001C3972C0|nr:AI-2E family transporter [Candidatus Helicobacter avicola]
MKGIYFFWLVFCFTLYWIYYLYEAFLMNLLVALLLCMATFGLKNMLLKYVRYEILAALFSTAILVLLLIVPVVFVFNSLLALIQGADLAGFSNIIDTLKGRILEWSSDVPEIQMRLKEALGKISGPEIFSYMLNFSSVVGKRSLEFVVDTGFIVVFLFFFYFYGVRLYGYMLSLIPFDRHQVQNIFNEVLGVLKVVCYTSVINVVLQGLSFGIAIAFFGYDGIFFGVLYGFCSLIPVVGGSLVWIPLVGYELFLGEYNAAIFIALYSLIFIAFVIDNLVKPLIIKIMTTKILKTPLQINEMLIFFAILAGLSAFGFWGIVLGPIITALFIALLRVYKKIIFPFREDFEHNTIKN